MPDSRADGWAAPDFRLLFESTPGAMLVLDRRLRVVAVSELYLVATMTEREDLLGRVVFDVFGAEGGEANAIAMADSRASFERVLGEGVVDVMAVQRYDIAVPGSDAHEVRFWSAVNSPVFASDGSVGYVIHQTEDVTRTVESEATSRLLAEHSTDVIVRVTTAGTLRYVSPASLQAAGWDAADLTGENAGAFVHPDDLELVRREHAALCSGADVITTSFRFRHRDGHYVWLEANARAVRDAAGEILEIQISARDVTGRKEVEESLRRSESLYRTLTENLPDASLFLLDKELRILVAEGQGVRQLPWFDQDMYCGRKVAELYDEVPAEVLDLVLDHYRATLRGQRREFDLEDSGLTFAVSSVPVRGEDGAVEAALVVARDVTRRRAAERQQRTVARLGQRALSDRELASVLDDAVAIVAETLGVELCELLEHHEGESTLRPVATIGLQSELVPPEGFPCRPDSQNGFALRAQAPLVIDDLRTESRFRANQTLLDHGMVSGVTVIVEGRDRPFGILSAFTTRHRAFDPADIHFLSAVANVLAGAIERDHELQASQTAALRDELTGLPNRTLAAARLDQALARRRRDGINAGALVLDLDRFKIINDSLGHAAGDELLRTLGARLSEAMRGGDTVARLGADEFVIICDAPAETRDIITVAERVMAAVRRPFVIGGSEFHLTASVGIAVATDEDETAASVLRDADAAMYRAKKAGPGRYEVFDEAMRVQVVARLQTEGDLRRAIAGDELRVHYQPVVDLESRRTLGVEALVRWEHPERGLIAPAQFIPVAEETGLIVDLGAWVLEEACSQVADWQQRYDMPLTVSVNVSGVQLADVGFPSDAAEVARRSGLRERTLRLEVTESVLIDEAGSPATVLDKLHDHGLPLVLDDFGTGYSSLSYLKHFPLDGIKLDRAFVRDLGSDPVDSAITEAVIRMASALGMSLTAEGIETEAQRRHLRRLGCTRGQGYLFARPLAADAMTSFLDGDCSASPVAR